jgi:hypothetical protein
MKGSTSLPMEVREYEAISGFPDILSLLSTEVDFRYILLSILIERLQNITGRQESSKCRVQKYVGKVATWTDPALCHSSTHDHRGVHPVSSGLASLNVQSIPSSNTKAIEPRIHRLIIRVTFEESLRSELVWIRVMLWVSTDCPISGC